MNRRRLGYLALLAAVLAAVVWVASLGPDPAPPPTTPAAAPTSTSPTTPSTEAPTTTSAEARIAEVEAILQDLYYRWFDAIYRQDADALWEVVATQTGYDDGVAAIGAMTFDRAPTREGVMVSVKELLLDRQDCLVAFIDVDVSQFRGVGAETSGVDVLWPDSGGAWRLATSWVHPNDLWIRDCDELIRDEDS